MRTPGERRRSGADRGDGRCAARHAGGGGAGRAPPGVVLPRSRLSRYGATVADCRRPLPAARGRSRGASTRRALVDRWYTVAAARGSGGRWRPGRTRRCACCATRGAANGSTCAWTCRVGEVGGGGTNGGGCAIRGVGEAEGARCALAVWAEAGCELGACGGAGMRAAGRGGLRAVATGAGDAADG